MYDDKERGVLEGHAVYIVLGHSSTVIQGRITAVNQTVTTGVGDTGPAVTFDSAYELEMNEIQSQAGDSGSGVFIVAAGRLHLLATFCSSEVYCVTTRARRFYAVSAYDSLLCLVENIPDVYIPHYLYTEMCPTQPEV